MGIIEKQVNRTGGVKKAKKELTGSKDWIQKIKSDSGEWNHNRMNILEIATSYYRKIYQHNTVQDKDDLTGTSNIPNTLYTEVIKAIDSLKSDKAPGPDGITNEILKESKRVITPVLTDMFNEILNTETIPQRWTETNIILLYKKGDKYEIGNYRPISLMSNIYKLFTKIILNRIEKRLDEHQPIEQAGFRKDYSVLDHIHVVR
ncbi:LINE-1 retrotransposable element ORF2 protein [Eumeta japonica]|uniref:LINE-1 retrotransposable element ORF2 protein n=1 Tax=Eumeta variegata TaxID=151549 RepID=A0A4C1Z288_EUMVA|nr:LINE-1 retrotransposable element ORF2 protein [Eumeta japonica]